MTYKYTFIASLLCATFLIGGCSGTKETLGLNRKAPDEFAVVRRAPLALPPDYALRPPEPGAPRPQEQETSKQAAVAVFGETSKAKNPASVPTSAEGSLLSKAGVADIDPGIRQKVDAETASRVDENKPVVDKLLSAVSDDDEVPASIVNAKEEAERLQKNKEEGKPATEGETPSIED